MIKLYQFPPSKNVSDISPFCLKVETYLRMANLDYESVFWTNPRRAPKGKLPFIEDEGEKIADSRLILKYLSKKYPNSLDQQLSATNHGVGLAVTRLLEEHFYWVLVYSRWIDKRYSPAVMQGYFSEISWPFRPIVTKLTKRKVVKALYAQGLGRHSQEEIYQMGTEDLDAVVQVLGEKEFLLGSTPCSYDASVFSFLAGLILVERVKTPLQRTAVLHENLKGYVRRMAKSYFSDCLEGIML